MAVFVTKQAPDFTAEAYLDGDFKTVSLSDYRGKNVVLFFYPLDFTFVCPTEIMAFSDRIDEFKSRGVEVLGVSVDSKFSHRAWAQVDRKEGGIKGIAYPLVADLKKDISREYGVLIEEAGLSLRGLFIINKEGVLKHVTINHNDLGRNVDEVLRLVDAIDFSEKYSEVCPANWQKGQAAMKPDAESLKKYLGGAELVAN
jgi:alkyl hydroperoxide reductase subunit AhpC